MLGSTLAEENNPTTVKPVDTLDGVYNESQLSFNTIAQLIGFSKMTDVMEIFAQKLISNLLASANSLNGEHMKVVDYSLDTLAQYLNNTVACR